MTDATGEIHNLITEQEFPAGVYHVEFDTKTYWKNEGSTPFHEVADVSINVTTPRHHYVKNHVNIRSYSFTLYLHSVHIA